MTNKKFLSFRFLLTVFFIILAAMIFAGLYPFNFLQSNRVQWLSNGSGIYFDGAGIAYTEKTEILSLKKAVSVELLLKERRGSKNWGPAEIFSIYKEAVSPSLLVGQWGGQIFVYSRFEKTSSNQWYRLFRSKQRLTRGNTHIVTVTFDKDEKRIYIDGKLRNKKAVKLIDRIPLEFSGSFLLGNSPKGKYGWGGEIRGISVYNRILLPDEIEAHHRVVFSKGMSGLAKTSGCLALYSFDEGKGETTKSILSKPRPFIIPKSLNAFGLSILSLPHRDMRFYGYEETDFFKNIAFFIPFGTVISAIILKKYATGFFATFLIVTLAGGLLSCVIEGLQFFLPTRVPGIADIIGNIIGSGFGMLVTYIALGGVHEFS